MPTYIYKCPNGHPNFERFMKIADYDRPQACSCGAIGVKQITAVMGFVQPNYEGYISPVTGKVVDGKKAHLEDLARSGCRLLEPGEKEQMLERRKKADEADDKAVERIADEFIASLPAPKVEKLAAEIISGADVAVTRG